MNRPVRRRALAAATLSLSLVATLAAPAAQATPALHLASIVHVPGGPVSTDSSQLVATEAPDGTVFVATHAQDHDSIWAVGRHGGAHLLFQPTSGLEATTALAADATYVYLGRASGIDSYRRSDGTHAQHWKLGANPRALSQLVVAGNRVWGLLTPLGFARRPSSIVELDPATPVRVRTVNGIADTMNLAPYAHGIFYVTNRSHTLVRLTNAGVRTTASTHLLVDQLLNGPAAVQALFVVHDTVVVRFDAGQGTDAGIYSYSATTLAGPGKRTMFNATSTLAWTTLGVLEAADGPAGDECPPGTPALCVRHYAVGSTGAHGPSLDVPYEQTGGPLGPAPAMVVANGSHVRVLRIS